MKTNIILTITLFSFIFANAQSFKVDNWVKPTKNGLQNTSSILISKKLNEKTSFVGFALTSTTGFAESYFGLSQKIGENTSVSLSVGFQSKTEKPLRFGTSLFSKKGKYSTLLIAEYGVNKTYWYKYQFKKVLQKKFSISIYGQRFAGHGMRVDYSLGKVGIWLAALHDTEAKANNIPFGIYVRF